MASRINFFNLHRPSFTLSCLGIMILVTRHVRERKRSVYNSVKRWLTNPFCCQFFPLFFGSMNFSVLCLSIHNLYASLLITLSCTLLIMPSACLIFHENIQYYYYRTNQTVYLEQRRSQWFEHILCKSRKGLTKKTNSDLLPSYPRSVDPGKPVSGDSKRKVNVK